jgi:hypothetical protein
MFREDLKNLPRRALHELVRRSPDLHRFIRRYSRQIEEYGESEEKRLGLRYSTRKFESEYVRLEKDDEDILVRYVEKIRERTDF